MSTVFSYDQSVDVMNRIKSARIAISEVFADCDKIAEELKENMKTQGVTGSQDVSQAALDAYSNLHKHYEQFIELIQNNEQNLATYGETMLAAQAQGASNFDSTQAGQNL